MTATITAVDQPGVYNDMPHDVYLADPVPAGSLSASGARKLLGPAGPARYQYERQHPPVPTKVFEHGHAAHRMVLGAGPDITLIDATDWRTKAAKALQAEARAAGLTPLLAADHARVTAMADAIRRHPIASRLFHPAGGDPEASLFWTDPNHGGLWRRARLDWLPNPGRGRLGHGRLIVPDYKTCPTAAPDRLEKAICDYGYHQQAAWYLDAVRALGLDDDPAFVFVFQEKDAPYLVNVIQLDADAQRIGADLNRKAIRIYQDCVAADNWPGYPTDITTLSLPTWAVRRHEQENPQ